MPICRSFHRMFSAWSFIFLFCSISHAAFGQFKLSLAGIDALSRHAGRSSLPNGIEVQAGDVRLKVVALRDDVLRVTYARGNSFPEDASWAVLPTSRQSSVPISIDKSNERFGFRTHALIVEVDKKTLQLTVLDPAGNVL